MSTEQNKAVVSAFDDLGNGTADLGRGDMVVQFGIREHEWPGGSFRGFDVPAGTYTRDTAFAYRIADGRIAERWAIRDDLGMLLQLGALRAGG